MSSTLTPKASSQDTTADLVETAPESGAAATRDAATRPGASSLLATPGALRPVRRISAKFVALFAVMALVLTVALAVERFELVVDGTTTSMTQFNGTVGEVLAAEDVVLGEGDEVTPSLATDVADGMVIEVVRAAQFTVVVDGAELEVATVADDVRSVVQAAGVGDITEAAVQPALGATASDGDVINITRPVPYFVAVDGVNEYVEILPGTVAMVLTNAGVELGADDLVSAPLDADVRPGTLITVTRVTSEQETDDVALAHDTVRVETSSRTVGEEVVVTEGSDGLQVDTYSLELWDGIQQSRTLASSEVTTEPVNTVVEVGTAPIPEPEPEPAPEPAPVAPEPAPEPEPEPASEPAPEPASTPKPAPAPAAPSGSVWDRLAQCESGGRWDLNVGTYDGGLQFHPQTWNSWKKSSYPQYAWQATRAQQIDAASRLQAAYGWGQWPACSSKLGLR